MGGSFWRSEGVCGRRAALLALAGILLVGGLLRSAGLYRGLDAGVVFHPDAPKQVEMLGEFLAGNPVKYRNSWFYDGYPYGLNVVDAALIRAGRMLGAPWAEWAEPLGATPETAPNALHKAALRLRVLYGLLTIVLVYATCRRFRLPRGASLVAAAIYAVAPLGAVVTHSATGDVGVDLFVALAMWFAAALAWGGGARPLLGFGLACGMAFACKYQGALAFWIAVPGLLVAVAPSRAAFASAVARGAAAFAAFVAGAVLLTPPLWVSVRRAWSDMRINFVNIKNFNVDPAFRDLPLVERVGTSLSENIPLVGRSLGWVLLAATLAALAWSVARWAASREQEGERTRLAWMIGVLSLPFVVILLSTSMKPQVQPFHFSFLVPVLAVAVAMLLAAPRRMSARFAAGALALAGLAEGAWASRVETFFWKRDELSGHSRVFSETVFREPLLRERWRPTSRPLKIFYAEPAHLSEFRNRSSVIRRPENSVFRHLREIPVPTVAWPRNATWVLLNGPILPINDREFLVPATGRLRSPRHEVAGEREESRTFVWSDRERGEWMERALVANEPLDRIWVGIRSGHLPTRYEVKVGGRSARAILPPESEVVFEIDQPRETASFEAFDSFPAVRLFRFRARAQLGPAWMAVMTTPREVELFTAFGPTGNVAAVTGDPEALALAERAMPALRYLESDRPWTLTTNAVPLVRSGTALAAGRYVFRAKLVNTSAPTLVRFTFGGRRKVAEPFEPFEQELSPGIHDVEWAFEKPFEPYDARLVASADHEVMVQEWSLRPVPGARPAAGPARDASARFADEAVSARVPRRAAIGFVTDGAVARRGEPLRFAIAARLDDAVPHKWFHDAIVFVHVRDAAGHRVAVLDQPLVEASFRPDAIRWRTFDVPADLAPGEYRVEGGVYNRTTTRRWRVQSLDGSPVAERAARLATLTVE